MIVLTLFGFRHSRFLIFLNDKYIIVYSVNIFHFARMTKQYVDKELLSDIANILKTLRARLNVNLEAFYFDTGIHLTRIEQSETNITVSTISQIYRYFNISLKDYFALVEQLKSNSDI